MEKYYGNKSDQTLKEYASTGESSVKKSLLDRFK